MKKRGIITLIVSIIILALLLYSYFSHGAFYNLFNLDADSAVSFLSQYKVWAIIIYILIMILEVVLAPIHPFLLYVIGGILFGPLVATIFAVVGGIIGGIIAFYIAKRWGRKWVESKVPEGKRKTFDKFSKKYGGWAMFLLRLNPLTSTDLWNYIAGISKIGFWPYIIGTTFGLIPATIIQVYLGIPIKNNPILFKILIIAIVLYLIIGILLFIGLKKGKSNKKQFKKNAKLPH
jgi:uncharacterized membrane protein YdjX (TVP38/TMEM64 family)